MPLKLCRTMRYDDNCIFTGITKIGKELTDAGRYSYTALCAISINHLFNSDWDKPFSKICLRKILNYVELPKQVIY